MPASARAVPYDPGRMAVNVPALHPVPDGPVAYRQRVRRYGPLAALALPAGLLLVAMLTSGNVSCDGRSCAVKGVGVLLLTLFALPTAMLAGLPWEGGSGRYLLTVATSAAVWMVLGAVAAVRATRPAVASWRDFWGELALLALGVWAGVLVALAVVALVLGVGFIS